MKYLVQIIVSSNTNLDILVRDVIYKLNNAEIYQIELINSIGYFSYKPKTDTNILQFELNLPEKHLSIIDYLHKITNSQLMNYKIRIFKLEY